MFFINEYIYIFNQLIKYFFPCFQPEPEFFRNAASSEVPNVHGGSNNTVEATAISAIPTTTSLLKGVLWQQREKRFSRWKERFFMLTNEYIQCFRKGTSKISKNMIIQLFPDDF